MIQITCANIQRWLSQAEHGSDPSIPPIAYIEHIQSCLICRGALAMLAGELIGTQALKEASSCEIQQYRLDTYLEYEREHGEFAALQRDPVFWWHLLLCEECSEVYHLTNTLLTAQERNELPPMPGLSPTPPTTRPSRTAAPRLPVIELTRVFLHSVFGMQRLLGAAWGDADEEMVVAEETQAGYQINISMQQQASTWSIKVLIMPPINGSAVISFGNDRFSAPFDTKGQAQISMVPDTLLADQVGPPMLVSIEEYVPTVP